MKASEAQLASLMDNVSDAVYIVDRQWRFTYANVTARQFANRTERDLIGQVVWEVFPHLCGTEFERRAHDVMNRGIAQSHEDNVPGSDIWAEARIYPAPDGLAVFVHDKTVNRNAAEQVRLHATLLDSVGESVIATDLEGRVVFWNAAAEKLYGWSEKESRGKIVYDLIHSPEFTEDTAAIRATVQSGQNWSGDISARKKDGSLFLSYASIVPITDEATGATKGSIGISLDVSEERAREARTREALARADVEGRRLGAILEASPVGIWIADADGRLTHRNPAAQKIWGGNAPLSQSVDEYREYKAWWLDSGKPVAPEEWALARTLRTGQTIVGEPLQIERFDGTSGFVLNSTAAIFDADGKVAGGLVAMLDVTEQQAQTRERDNLLLELEHERNRLSDVFRQAPAFMAAGRGPTHVFELANEAYYQLIGFRQVIGKPIAEALPEVVEQGFIQLLDEVYRTGIPYLGHNQRLLIQRKPHAEPEERFIDFVYAPLKERDGSIAGIFAMGTDVTEREHLESRLRRAQRMEAVGNLAGGIAHDFNNLLTVIQNCSDFLLEEVDEQSPMQADIIEISKASQRAAVLTRQLLAFSRRQLLQPKILDPNKLIASLHAMLQRLIGENIQILVHPGAELGNVLADEGQIEQVIVNLVVNARDAMPMGGRVDIETANVELDATFSDGVDDLRSGPYVLIAVTDTGTGMSDAIRSRIFEPFFTTKEPGKGTGLGLSTVYGIIQQSNGRIFVYSEEGQGTSFKIYLPRESALASPESKDLGDEILGGTETILLVEDEHAVRSLAKRLLTREGYHVLDTHDGADAIRIAESTPSLRLVVTDVVMPKLMGTQIWEKVSLIRPDARVLFMSGYTDDDVLRRGLIDSTTNFLQKPFTASSLLSMVRRILSEPMPEVVDGR